MEYFFLFIAFAIVFLGLVSVISDFCCAVRNFFDIDDSEKEKQED